MTKPILVINATGKVGRRVHERLAERGVATRAVTRRTSPAFDWDDEASWAPALVGTRSAYVSYQPDLAAPDAPEKIARFVELARAAGLTRLVLLSGRGEDGAVLSENVLKQSGLEFTILRASWFHQNFSEGHMLPAVLGGTIVLPAGDKVEPFVDADDIADVAVAALLEDRHVGETYEITGPDLLTFADAANILSDATGRPVSYLPVDAETFHAALAADFDVPTADLLTEICRQVFDGRNEWLGDGVQRALGRPPRSLADFARAAAATGVWKVAA